VPPQSLNLSWNRLGDEGVCAVAGGVPQSAALRELHLSSTSCSDEAAFALTRALDLEAGSVLEVLSLDGNRIGEEGLRALRGAADAREGALSVIATGLTGTVFLDDEGHPWSGPLPGASSTKVFEAAQGAGRG